MSYFSYLTMLSWKAYPLIKAEAYRKSQKILEHSGNQGMSSLTMLIAQLWSEVSDSFLTLCFNI